MEDRKIPQVEKDIYIRIDFADSILKIRKKYNNDGRDHPYIKVNDVKRIFKSLMFPYEYVGENSHQIIIKEYKDYCFKINYIIKDNYVEPRYYVLKQDKLVAPEITNLYYVLNFISYNKALLNENFRINTVMDLKNYILDIKDLCEKFTEEYIKEIDNGNV